MPPTRVSYCDGDTELLGQLIRPTNPATACPALVLAPTRAGINAFAYQKAEALNALGYAVFIADLFGQGRSDETSGGDHALQALLDNRFTLRRRIALAVARLELEPSVDPHRIGVIGYSFGGLCALEYARSGASSAAVISVHGALHRDDTLFKHIINTPVLVIHGHDDPLAGPDEVLMLQQELSECQADWQMHTLGSAMHGFSDPEANDPVFGSVYNASADQRAWTMITQFLHQQFSDIS